ncbi:MAG: ferredoxin, 2Fe-2S [Chloroflexi bacterium]|jgi:ferredoxin|nr:MAG: ferredoxin, 2Fe-2S [Chloroflexota bacterium]
MPKLRIEPSGIEFEVPSGVTIMQAARDAGYFWPNQCDMQSRCSNCFFRVVEGLAALSPMGRAEQGTLLEQRGRKSLNEPVRLGCQVRIDADVLIHKIGVREDPFA